MIAKFIRCRIFYDVRHVLCAKLKCLQATITYSTEDQGYFISSSSIIIHKVIADHLNLIYGGHWFKLRGTLTKVGDQKEVRILFEWDIHGPPS